MHQSIRNAACAVVCLAIAAPTGGVAQKSTAPASPTLARIKQSGRIRFGYRTEARPFSYRDSTGSPAGFAIALCEKVSGEIKATLGLAALKVEWVPVGLDDRFAAVQQGTVDMLCGADTETLTRRELVSFSIPVFPGGIGALLRADAPPRLWEILAQKPRANPSWRASAGALLQEQTFSVITGTTADTWLAGKLTEFKLPAKVVRVANYQEGLERLDQRKTSVFFGDRAILFDAVARHPGHDIRVLDRWFTYEAVGLTLPRGDESLRVIVDRTLSRLYPSAEFRTLYLHWFMVEPDSQTVTFYRWNTRPQ